MRAAKAVNLALPSAPARRLPIAMNESLLLAYQIQKSLVRNLGAEDRGVRRARFAVLRDTTMPAILIEGGYMTHPVEGRYSSAMPTVTRWRRRL